MQYPTFLEATYKHFTHDEEEMDVFQFEHFANACHLIDRRVSKSEVKNIFLKSSDPVLKKICYETFKQNLGQFAAKQGVTKNDIVKKVESFGRNLNTKDCYCNDSSSENYIGSRPDVSSCTTISADSSNSI